MNRVTTVLLYNFGNPPLFLWNQIECPTCQSWHLFSDMVMYFETVIFLSGDLLPGILYPYSKKVSSIHAIPSPWEKYKVLCTCASHPQLYSCFIVWALLVPQPCCSANPSAQSRVHLPQWCSLCSRPCRTPSDLQSKVQRHKEGSENILCNGRCKRTNGYRIKEGPTFVGCKAFEPEFDTFWSECRSKNCSLPLIPEIFISSIQILHNSEVTHIYKLFLCLIYNQFSPLSIFKFLNIFPKLVSQYLQFPFFSWNNMDFLRIISSQMIDIIPNIFSLVLLKELLEVIAPQWGKKLHLLAKAFYVVLYQRKTVTIVFILHTSFLNYCLFCLCKLFP